MYHSQMVSQRDCPWKTYNGLFKNKCPELVIPASDIMPAVYESTVLERDNIYVSSWA